MALPLGAIQVAVVSAIATFLAITALALRIWSKRILHRPLVFHDYMAGVAMLFTAGAVSVFLAAGFAAGLGLHLNDIMATDPAIFALHLKLFVPAQLLWAAANTCVKISILSLYTSLFPSRRFVLLCYVTMGVTAAYFISVLLETFLLCKPVEFNWDKSIPNGTCEGQNTAYLVAGITNLVIDVFVVVMPMPMLWGLRMSLRKRLGLIGMFSLGGLICVMSMLRVIWLHTWDLTDMTYTVTPGAIYSVVEPTLGVVNACLPTIKPAVNQLLGRQNTGGPGTKNSSSDSRNLRPSQLNSKGLYSNPKNHLYGNMSGQYARPAGFERLEDDITLVNISSEPLVHPGIATMDANGNMNGSITVSREWAVRSV